MAGDSPCPELEDLQRLALNQLSPAEALRLQKHMVRCVICAQAVRDIKEASHFLAKMPAPSGGPALGPSTVAPALASGAPSARHVPDAPRTPPPAPKGLTEDEFLAPAQGPDEIGRLGEYRVLKLLGTGGMGMVFLAEDPRLRRKVALKAMRPNLTGDDVSRQRFLQEARAAAALEHDHIVTIFQTGEDRGVLFLAMSFLQGETLEDRLYREKRLPVAEVVRIGREAAEGLAAAHAHGLVHRDIKPSNLWLEAGRGRVKILDFGLARGASDPGAHLTETGFVVGTAGYMSPEQARGQPTDGRCDLFSLGVVLYEASTGVRPFQGSDTMARLMALALEQPAPPQHWNPELPPKLSELILWLLSKNPDDRPHSGQLVAEALAAMEQDVKGGSSRSINLPASAAKLPTRPESPAAVRRASHPAPAEPGSPGKSLLTGVLLVLIAVGCYFLVSPLFSGTKSRGPAVPVKAPAQKP